MVLAVTLVDDPASAEPQDGAFMRITSDKEHPMFIPDICWSAHSLYKRDGETVLDGPLLKGFREGDLLTHIKEWLVWAAPERVLFMTKEAAIILTPLMSYPRVRFELVVPDEDIRTACLSLWSSSLKFS